MMKFSHKYQFVKYISRIFSILPRSKGCRILMYHSLDQKLEDDIDWKYKLEKSLFEAQMNLLKSKIPSFVKQLNTKTLKEDSMIITFDDGFLDTLIVAAPVLIERDLPFTVFVSPGLINSNDPRYLSKNSLKSLPLTTKLPLPFLNITLATEDFLLPIAVHCKFFTDTILNHLINYQFFWVLCSMRMFLPSINF